jgi:hypothetical protein
MTLANSTLGVSNTLIPLTQLQENVLDQGPDDQAS